MSDSSNIYVGLDVHKASIAVAVACAGRGEPESFITVEDLRSAITRQPSL